LKIEFNFKFKIWINHVRWILIEWLTYKSPVKSLDLVPWWNLQFPRLYILYKSKTTTLYPYLLHIL
jgi:hypothetical protein